MPGSWLAAERAEGNLVAEVGGSDEDFGEGLAVRALVLIEGQGKPPKVFNCPHYSMDLPVCQVGWEALAGAARGFGPGFEREGGEIGRGFSLDWDWVGVLASGAGLRGFGDGVLDLS